jgi:gamma-glutamyltranspeptidase/glutathione hydrolase
MDGNRPTVASRHGVVAAAHPLAAAAGARILGRGGNAFDAAVATAAALNVVEPFMSGLAGLGMATCWVAGDRRIRTLGFRTAVPEQYPMGRFSQREDLHFGAMAAAPPGNLAGWYDLLSAHGTKTLADVLAPAIALAREGFPLLEFNAASINAAAAALRDKPFFEAWNTTYTEGRGSVRLGQVLRQPDLANTLEAIAAEGPKHLYGGRLGQKLVAHVQSLGGCMGMGDLEAVSPSWDKPVSAAYRDLTVHTVRPPSQAFQYLLTLRILDGFELGKLERDGVEHLDLVWRAVRLAAMERIAHDDPSADELERLLSDEAVGRLRHRVADGRPIEGQVEQWLAPAAGKGPEQHTTSLSVADRAGNLVCITQSLGAVFGCGVVVPGTGVCLNNALYWGEHDPRATNGLRPGRKLTSPMAPSVATRGRTPVLALGTPGSYGICQTQPQALVQYVDYGLALQDAVAAPRARLWDGRRVTAESRISGRVLEALRERGHAVEAPAAWTMQVGGMQAVAVDPATGVLTGAADPRRDGYVATA